MEHKAQCHRKRKGSKTKDEPAHVSTARQIIGSRRATIIEGSIGNQKQNYSVGRIAALTQHRLCTCEIFLKFGEVLLTLRLETGNDNERFRSDPSKRSSQMQYGCRTQVLHFVFDTSGIPLYGPPADLSKRAVALYVNCLQTEYLLFLR